MLINIKEYQNYMISLCNIQNREIVVFGTGLNAAKCTYYLKNKGISVKHYLNNYKSIDSFMGRSVYDLKEHIYKDIYVLVAVGDISAYITISNQLQSLGMQEFSDYLYYGWLNKSIVLLHGNCHMVIIKNYLESSKKFGEQYAIYPNPTICENKKRKIDNVVLRNCDVWIHEDIQRNNGYGYYLSDEFLRETISKNPQVREIIVPHLFGLGKAFSHNQILIKEIRQSAMEKIIMVCFHMRTLLLTDVSNVR